MPIRRCCWGLLLALGLGTPRSLGAQAAPWTVTVAAGMNPLPIGFCAAVRLDIRDPKSGDMPRNPAGYRMSLADFDMTVTSAGKVREVVGQQSGPGFWQTCACQAGTVGSVATITATYPAARLTEKERTPGVAFQTTATFTLGPAKGPVDAVGCAGPPPTAIAAGATPLEAVPGKTIPAKTPAPEPPAGIPPAKTPVAVPPSPAKTPSAIVPVNPTALTAMQTGPGMVRLTWPAVNGVAYYGLFGPGVTVGGEKVMAGTTMFMATAVPGGSQEWMVGSFYLPGPVSTAVSLFPRATLNVVAPMNPAGFIAKQTGAGQVTLSWQPVEGAAYYGLFGPGVTNGGEQVPTGTTSFTAKAVPLGSQQWSVGTYYMPGQISTGVGTFPTATLNVTAMLTGWVDLHTHPMVHLGFGGHLVHGGVDEGTLLRSDASCNKNVRATSMAQALGSDAPSHGGWNLVSLPCGDDFRKLLIHEFQSGNHALTTASPAFGWPSFDQWPKWNDITHQKMWYEWIRRARDGGLRVMVALATNNKTLADAMSGGNLVTGSAEGPTDDQASGKLQVTEIKAFVGRHPDFMEVAYGSADIERIVQSNRIAVVLGVELDNIGNFNKLGVANLPPAAAQSVIAAEIQAIYDSGARYIFPIHVLDNVFGGTAIYQGGFNTSNLREAGHFWDVECADVSDNITHNYVLGVDPMENILKDAVTLVKLGMDPLRHPGPPPVCPPVPQPAGQPQKGRGHRNALGLTPNGVIAIKEMMKRGMLIDIDHMSQKAADATLDLAESLGYPLLSGHTGIRGQAGSIAENARTVRQLERLSKLHGMFGLGSDGSTAFGWARLYQTAMIDMGYRSADPLKANYESGAVAFGTDLNGLVKGPAPPNGIQVVYDTEYKKSKSVNKEWDYNVEGVAHYGMLSDFVKHVRKAPSIGYTGPGGVALGVAGEELVNDHLSRSAHYFWQMWQRIEAKKAAAQTIQ